MIVKVEIEGDSATMSTHPKERKPVYMVVPADRLRPRFTERAPRLVGFFEATEATARNVATFEAIPLGVLEVGERLTSPPEDAW